MCMIPNAKLGLDVTTPKGTFLPAGTPVHAKLHDAGMVFVEFQHPTRKVTPNPTALVIPLEEMLIGGGVIEAFLLPEDKVAPIPGRQHYSEHSPAPSPAPRQNTAFRTAPVPSSSFSPSPGERF